MLRFIDKFMGYKVYTTFFKLVELIKKNNKNKLKINLLIFKI
jgi:hypothetical protein